MPVPGLLSSVPPWARGLLAVLALSATLIGLQGKLPFGRTRVIRRTDPGPAAARRCTQAGWLARPGGVQLQGWPQGLAREPARTPAGSIAAR